VTRTGTGSFLGMDEEAPPSGSLSGLLERVTGLVELLTTLDMRVRGALDGLEEMRGTITGFEDLGSEGDALVADVRNRVAALDKRLNQDLDAVRDAIVKKIGELDVQDFSTRFGRLEQAVLNIERATVNLDQAFQGTVEMLPNFLTRRVKEEGEKASPTSAPPPSPG
jgi:hypothetical protein